MSFATGAGAGCKHSVSSLMDSSFYAMIAGRMALALELKPGNSRRSNPRGPPYFCVNGFSITADCASAVISS
jgi:hypothetical protein